MTDFKDCFWGPNGFEELKKYMRLGNDFCRDLASILLERSESELNYSKSLNKTSQRLQKLSKDFHGDLSEAWLQVSMQFDTEADTHKAFSSALQEELVKPLKALADTQAKFRKPIELRVEKTVKNYTDKKLEDYKYRSRCFQLVKDIEKSMYSLDEAQKGVGGKPPNQKEIQRLEAQIVKSKEQLEKSEVKYHKACAAVELARQDWQTEILKCCNQMQTLEMDRISQLEQLIKKLTLQVNLLSKKMLKVVDVFQNIKIDVDADLKLACKKYGTGANDQEISLYDVYSENTKNMMNRERRVANLQKWNDMLAADVHAQVRSRQGLDKVKTFAKENPNFGGNNEADIGLKFESVRLLQYLFEASLYKVQMALADLSEKPAKPTFSLASQITTTYDKQGVPLSILKLASQPVETQHCNSSSSSAKPSAPSPPSVSPPYPPSSIGLINSSSTHSFSSSTASSSHYAAAPLAPHHSAAAAATGGNISMPIPYHFNPYDSSSVAYGAAGGGGESSSASSISTASSVSPATSSSTQHSQSSPLPSSSNLTLPPSIATCASDRTASYLLTTATNHPPPPSYAHATTLSRKDHHHHHGGAMATENPYSNSDSEDDDEWNESPYHATTTFIGKCEAQYDYKGLREDELTLKTGDVIEIIEKRSDGWWRGQLQNSIGLFPSTYVKE